MKEGIELSIVKKILQGINFNEKIIKDIDQDLEIDQDQMIDLEIRIDLDHLKENKDAIHLPNPPKHEYEFIFELRKRKIFLT